MSSYNDPDEITPVTANRGNQPYPAPARKQKKKGNKGKGVAREPSASLPPVLEYERFSIEEEPRRPVKDIAPPPRREPLPPNAHPHLLAMEREENKRLTKAAAESGGAIAEEGSTAVDDERKKSSKARRLASKMAGIFKQ